MTTKPKNNIRPRANIKVKCNWCDTEMLGKNLSRHNRENNHEYRSYCPVIKKTQPKMTSIFKKKNTVKKKTSEEPSNSNQNKSNQEIEKMEEENLELIEKIEEQSNSNQNKSNQEIEKMEEENFKLIEEIEEQSNSNQNKSNQEIETMEEENFKLIEEIEEPEDLKTTEEKILHKIEKNVKSRAKETEKKEQGKKRIRQTTLFEAYSPLKQMELQIQKKKSQTKILVRQKNF